MLWWNAEGVCFYGGHKAGRVVADERNQEFLGALGTEANLSNEAELTAYTWGMMFALQFVRKGLVSCHLF